MSNLFIVKASHTAGPQTQTVIESQKAQISNYAVTVFDYALHANAQTLSESQQAQIAYAVTNLSYS